MFGAIRQLAKRIEFRHLSVENPNASLDLALRDAQSFGGPVQAKVSVTAETAMRLAAVYACVNVLAQTVAALPAGVYRRLQRGRVRDPAHPLAELLSIQPNPNQTWAVLAETLTVHLLVHGNAYLWIEMSGGRPVGLWLQQPDQVEPRRRPDGTRFFLIREAAGRDLVRDESLMLHIPALGFDGLIGRSPIAMQRETVGAGIAARDFGSRFFANDARPGLALETPPGMSPDNWKALKDQLETKFSGVNQHRPLVFGPGIKPHTLTIPMDDAQFIEGRKYTRSEIAGIFRVPPHMIGDLERATFSNIEQQDIALAKHSILPWVRKIEQEIDRKLFAGQDHFFRFQLDGLQRGDFKTRTEGYASAIQNGWMTRNEVRALENLPPLEGLDEPLRPLAMTVDGEGVSDDN